MHFQPVKYQYKNVDAKSLDTLLVFGDSITFKVLFLIKSK